MLVHDRPDLAQLGIDALHGLGYKDVFVHIDARKVKHYPKLNDATVGSHVAVDWGSHRMMDAEISSIKQIMRSGVDFDHIMICSGKDLYGTLNLQSICKPGISYQPYFVETSNNYLNNFNLNALDYSRTLIDYKNIKDTGFTELKTSSSWIIISKGDCIRLTDNWDRYLPIWYNRICVEEHFPASTINLRVLPYLYQVWDSEGNHPIDLTEDTLAHLDVSKLAMMRKVNSFELAKNYYHNILKVA